MGHGHGVFTLRTGAGQLIQGCAAGIEHAQDTGYLVEALPRRVIPCGAEDFQFGVILDIHNHAVAAGHHQTEERRFQLRKGQIVGSDMTPDMMDRNQRDLQSHGRCLGKVDTHQHRTDETRRIGDTDSVNVLPGDTCRLQCLVGQTINGFDVLAGGDFRHYAAVGLMDSHLRRNAVGQHRPAIPNHGHRRLVAGGFNG